MQRNSAEKAMAESTARTMKAVRTALLLILVACQSDSSTVAERAARHTQADRTHAMAALSAGLDAAYLSLQAAPADVAGALAKARPEIARYYSADETGAFQLWTGAGEWMLYIPGGHVWLARTKEHLVVEPNGLAPEARSI